MASNVELRKPCIVPIIDEPSIDVFTQRRRLPKLLTETTAPWFIKQHPETLFSKGSTAGNDRFRGKDTYTYTIDGNALKSDSNNFQYVGERKERLAGHARSGSRPGAFLPWPPNKAGEKIDIHMRRKCLGTLAGIELQRRPPTNLPGEITMAFGRATPGYYAHRNPQQQTWFNSAALKDRWRGPTFGPGKYTSAQYLVCDQQQVDYINDLYETTEYQDRYLAHKPVEKSKRFTVNTTASNCPP